jgi:HPt (histidine-containing phosphotransfer) domain-containing protein
MKGASSNVGAERIERLAIRIEQDAHRGVLPALPETLSSLRSELEQIPRALEASTS